MPPLSSEIGKFFSTPRGVFFHRPGIMPPRFEAIRLQAAVSVQGLSNKFVVVQFRDYEKQIVSVKLSRADLKAFHKFRHALEDAGYEFPADLGLAKQLHQVVVQLVPYERWELVDRVGWHGDEFVLPNRPGSSDGRVLRFEGERSEYHVHYACRGSLANWQTLVAAHALHSSRLLFAISLAFAAPLMRFAAIEPGGFHLFGKSTTGKTTCLIAASSVIGPGIRSELLNWDITDAGLEEVAAGHNDGLLCLDEVGQIRTDAITSVAKKLRTHAFKLAGGRGRIRSSLWGHKLGARELRWRLLLLSTGELALSKLASDADIQKLKGEEVRLIDLPAVTQGNLGIYETLPNGFSSADEALHGIAKACEENSGVAFNAFWEKLRANIPAMTHAVQHRMDVFLKAARVPADPWERRFAQRFALAFAAAALAAEFGVVPWRRQQIGQAIKSCYIAARAAIPDAQHLLADGLAVLRAQLSNSDEVLDLKREGHKISWTPEQVKSRTIYRRFGATGVYFLVSPATFLSWFNSSLQAKLVLDKLDEGGFLMKDARKLRTIQTAIAGIDGRAYYHAISETVSAIT